jgi:hypothetical protein
VDLALCSILVHEPVVPKGLGVLLSGEPHDLGNLILEPLQLTGTDLQVSVQFQMSHDSSSMKAPW